MRKWSSVKIVRRGAKTEREISVHKLYGVDPVLVAGSWEEGDVTFDLVSDSAEPFRLHLISTVDHLGPLQWTEADGTTSVWIETRSAGKKLRIPAH